MRLRGSLRTTGVFPGCPHAGPTLTVDAEGTLHVAWYTGQEDGPGMYYTKSVDGAQTFRAPVPLLTDEWVPPSQAKLAADSRGRLWVAWEDRRLDKLSFRYFSATPGTSMRVEEAELQLGTNPVLAVAGDRPALAWLDGDRVLLRTGADRP